MHCGTRNANFSQEAAIVAHPGARPGWKQHTHSGFNLDQLVQDTFEGVRAVTDAGKQVVDDWALQRNLMASLGGVGGAASGSVVTDPPLLQQVQAEPAPTVAPVVAPMPRGSDAGASSTARPQGAPGPAHDRLALERQYKQKAPWRCISMTCGNVNATSVFVCQKCGRDALKFFRCTAKVKSLPCGNRQPAILQCCLKCHAPVKLP